MAETRQETPNGDAPPPETPLLDEDVIEGWPCKACGASLTFAPGTTELKCPYCGAENAIEVELTTAEEHDIESLPLRPATAETGMGRPQRSWRCEACGAVQAVDPAAITVECAFCGSPAIIEVASDPNLVRPTALVPFAIDEKAARGRYRQWLGKWWRKLISPGALQRDAVVTKVRGIYAPFFTFDAQAESDWSGWRGDYYYVTVGSGKNRRTVRRTRWSYRSGHNSHFYDDVLVYASRGLPEATLQKVTPFQLGGLMPFQSEFLAGFAAEEYTVDPKALWGSAQNLMKSAEWQACRRALGGDTYRNLRVATQLQRPTWKHILLPLYVANYTYGAKAYNFMVNGQTGEVQGTAPISWAKVGLIVGAVAAAVAGVLFFLGLF